MNATRYYITMEREAPLGVIHLLATDQGLTHILWPEHKGHAETLTRLQPILQPDHPWLQRAREELESYFAGTSKHFTTPLAMEGTPFQKEVWAALRQIPWGETWSYADLADAVGRPTAARAVGAANGRNPISIIVPCHRVIGSNGTLTGYAGGIPTKRWLLHHEGALNNADASTSAQQSLFS